VIYGEPGSGKSFLAVHFGYMLSMGWPIFERRVHGVPVLYVALEGERGFEKRIRACMQKWAVSATFYFTTESADLYNGQGGAEGIINSARAVEAEFTVIDTLARAMGAGNENESSDMGCMIEAFDVIRREANAHICVVHHSRSMFL
jgi:RecA-family ATPase